MTPDRRARALIVLARYVGLDLPSRFFRRTGEECPEAGIPVLHSLSEGIFKPADSQYALCIWSRSAGGGDREIYPDSFQDHDDGTWSFAYSAKSGSLDSAINRSLLACMRDKVLVLAITTAQPKSTRGGARYRLLGPALIHTFDPGSRRFLMLGGGVDVAAALAPVASEEELETLALRNRLILPMSVGEERARYYTSREARDRAFRQLILGEYYHLCCVCKSLFLLREKEQELVEAEAAHIIPVPAGGPDDPRNGLSLCKRHHWSFDQGLFTVSAALEVRISPAVRRARRQNFDLEEFEGLPIVSPAHTICAPDEQALSWHQQHVFREH